jgi:SAM-dependent methyltransferase
MMHAEALTAMRNVMRRYAAERPGPATVLDVGSLDVNGTYRPMVQAHGWRYTGLDLASGPNVDVVAGDPHRYPLPDDGFDLVISGSTMEHVQAIWLWVPELARVLRPGGMLAILTHWCFGEHRFPVDCWRIMPDGMRCLFDLTGRLERYDIRIINASDILGVAWKQ